MVQHGYGHFPGGDPRKFHPDGEDSNSPEEIANHKAACKLWDEAEARGEKPTPEACPSGWIDLGGGRSIHILNSPYGLGIYEYDDGEPEDEPN